MVSLTAILFFTLLQREYAFSVPRKALAGIWKLKIPAKYDGAASSSPVRLTSAKDDATVVLRVLEDGTFQQYNDANEDVDRSFNKWSGMWNFEDDCSEIQLALDRHCTIQDAVFQGKVVSEKEGENSSANLQIQQGRVSAGKFMYPPNHRNFFDQPLAVSEPVGKFDAHQVMGFANFLGQKEEPSKPPRQFSQSDFHHRSFYLTVTPIESKTQSNNDQLVREQPFDIRTMTIEFHVNNTFTCLATNKILRGKFEITDEDGLFFYVSRFGAGKSAPGSVYSEGMGLSHEDERAYTGAITRRQVSNDDGDAVDLLQVQGTVFFGADMGSDMRPEPVGTFLLREVNDTSLLDTSNKDDEEQDLFDSVFE